MNPALTLEIVFHPDKIDGAEPAQMGLFINPLIPLPEAIKAIALVHQQLQSVMGTEAAQQLGPNPTISTSKSVQKWIEVMTMQQNPKSN